MELDKLRIEMLMQIHGVDNPTHLYYRTGIHFNTLKRWRDGNMPDAVRKILDLYLQEKMPHHFDEQGDLTSNARKVRLLDEGDYTIVTKDSGQTIIASGEDDLISVVGFLTDDHARQAVSAYYQGIDAGKVFGRIELKKQFNELMKV